jgi:mannose-6-phosphate isomerase-like protein (cupin superfamily)
MTIERKPASAKNAEHYLWGDGCDGWHLLNRDDVSVIQERMPLGTSEQMHYHKIARQFFFVLDGRATMEDLSFLVFSVPKSHKDRYER